MRFLAYHTKGLDRVVRWELVHGVPEVELLWGTEKYVVFETGRASVGDLLECKTPDDVHRLLAVREHDRKPDADMILDGFPFERLGDAKDLLREIRDLDDTFSLTVSRYRNDHVALETLESGLADRIGREYGWTFTERDHSNLDVRVHVDETDVLVSCRLSAKPLYYRDYKEHGRAGSLRPSIAAALVLLTDPSPGAKLVDAFCGVGTILCEGVRQGLEPYGGDIDAEAVRFAEDHLRALSVDPVTRLSVLDARDTRLPDGHYDLAVSNVPWGDQVDLNAVDLYSQAIPEYARILSDRGSIVLLGPKPDLLRKNVEEHFPEHTVGQFRLGFLGQRPWVTHARPPGSSLNVE